MRAMSNDEKSDSVSLQSMPPRLDSDSDHDNGGNLPDFDDEDHGPLRSTAPCYCRHCVGRNMLSKRQRSRHRQKFGWAANAPQAWTMHFVVQTSWHALPHPEYMNDSSCRVCVNVPQGNGGQAGSTTRLLSNRSALIQILRQPYPLP